MSVLVVGMHRSGTSALAGALEALGLFVGPSDALIGPHPTNLDGHFELRAVADLNDEILAHFGGAWDWPPALPDGWMADPAVQRFLVRARELVRSTFAGRQFLLKDPRLCLLLPFWRRVLSDHCCAVLITRHPAEVAWSLARRDEMPSLTSLALWSAYSRSALEGLSGLPVHVCRYSQLVERPVAVLDGVVASLREFGELPPEADVAAATAHIKTELRTAVGTREQRELTGPSDVVALDTILKASDGRHDRFEPGPLPERSRWEQPLLEERRGARSQLRALDTELTRTRLELSGTRLELSGTRLELSGTRLELTHQFRSAESERHALECRLSEAERRATEHEKAIKQRTSERDGALSELALATATERRLRQRLAMEEGALAYFDGRQDRRERHFVVRVYRALQRRTNLRLGEKEGARVRPYFDAAWYLETYPDVGADGLDPLTHYVRFGEREGRRPNAYFDPEGYLKSYPDVAVSGLGPLEHYARFGRKEGRRPGSDTIGGMRASDGARRRRASRTDGDADREVPWFIRSRSQVRQSEETPTASRSILVIDVSVPLTDQDSGSCRMFQILSLLRHLGHAVTFGADALRGTEQHVESVRELGIEVLVGPDAIQEFLTSTPLGVGTVWVARPEVAARYIPMVKAFSPTSAVIYDTVDLHWRRFDLQAIFDTRVTQEEIRRWRLLENTLFSWADHVIAITEEDAALIRGDNSGAKVSVIPNVHDKEPVNVGYEARRDLVFVGGYHHAPNVDAVEHFVERILPLVVKELPDVRFFIVGSNLEQYLDIEPTDNIVPVGFVPELEPCLAQFRIMVVPLRYGAGMKGKVGSSLVNGLPVVTTPVGAEGMELVDGVTALIAEDDESFARAVVTLYRDGALWDKISEQGRAHAEALYSPAVVEKRLDGVLRQVL
jgi:glycosyltransferase involved in cell wall biosynthesis